MSVSFRRKSTAGHDGHRLPNAQPCAAPDLIHHSSSQKNADLADDRLAALPSAIAFVRVLARLDVEHMLAASVHR